MFPRSGLPDEDATMPRRDDGRTTVPRSSFGDDPPKVGDDVAAHPTAVLEQVGPEIRLPFEGMAGRGSG
jgi:hypothetical protein